jgi:hypothetical protein
VALVLFFLDRRDKGGWSAGLNLEEWGRGPLRRGREVSWVGWGWCGRAEGRSIGRFYLEEGRRGGGWVWDWHEYRGKEENGEGLGKAVTWRTGGKEGLYGQKRRGSKANGHMRGYNLEVGRHVARLGRWYASYKRDVSTQETDGMKMLARGQTTRSMAVEEKM